MKTQKKFIQVHIESEADLPKEGSYYPVLKKGASIPIIMFLSKDSINWKEFDWYLIEEDQPVQNEQCENELAEKIERIFKNVQRIHGKSESLDWIKIASLRSAGNILGLNRTATLGGGISDGFEPGSLNNPIQPTEENKARTAEDEMNKFRQILFNYCIHNQAHFTSNEFHTIWNAVKEYRNQGVPTITDEEINEQFLIIENPNNNYVTEALNNAANFKRMGAKWAVNKLRQ